MSFINKVKDKNNVSYDIHDERVPEILAENEGKILKVQGGELTFADAPAGGTKLYKHSVVIYYGGPVLQINVINTSATPLTFEYFLNESGNIGYDDDSGRVSFEVNGYIPVSEAYGGPGHQVKLYRVGSPEASYSPSELRDSDTVTEL